MVLHEDDALECIMLLSMLDSFIIQKTDSETKTIEKVCYTDLEIAERIMARNYLYQHAYLYDEFMNKNYYQLSKKELEIIAAWSEFGIRGTFLVTEYSKDYAYFIQDGIYYAVKCLNDRFDKLVKTELPFWILTSILPYKGTIIWDGLLALLDGGKDQVVFDLTLKNEHV